MTSERQSLANSALSAASLGTGTEWVVDAYDCHPARLSNLQSVREICDRVVSDLELKVVASPQWHRFPEPGGVTGMYLLSESHLTCHTYPEFGFATFNLYCCRHRETWEWEAQLRQTLGADHISVRQIERGREMQRGEEDNLLGGGAL